MSRCKKPREDWTGQRLMAHAPVESESSVQGRIVETLSRCGNVHVMRNNVGAIKKGPRYIKYGLGVGSSDIVAIVGPSGRWLCLEVKRPEKSKTDPERLEAQRKWRARMAELGAVVGEVRTVDEALDLLQQARRSAT